jgi:hypothetical protein
MKMPEGEKRGRIGGGNPNPYYEDRKYPEPTVCPRCGLVYRHGRWQPPNSRSAEGAHESHCPACRREIDRLPGGLLILKGSYLDRHRDEILSIARNQQAAAAAQRPLQRILWIEDSGTTIEIATTIGHLAQRIGKAVESACKGRLTLKHAPEDQLLRIYWERDQ